MNIAHLDPPHFGDQGDHVYRSVQPCRALGQLPGVHVVSGTWLTRAMRDACRAADLLVVNKAVDPDLLPLIEDRRRQGLRTVYEINDDFAALHDGHPTRAFYARPDNRALLTQLARRSDAVQFSSRGLARRYGHLNACSAVFPNQLWAMPQRQPTRPCTGRITLGWAGSAGHLQDLQHVVGVFEQLLDRFPQLDLAVMGGDALRALFSRLKGRVRLHPPGSLADYNAFLQTLDIGVAPLLDTPFNRGRSDVKYLEYAAAGAVAVCAAVGPYRDIIEHGQDGMLYESTEQLFEHLALLVHDGVLRRALAEQAWERVGSTRLESAGAHSRYRFYMRLCSDPDTRGDSEGFAAAIACASQRDEDSAARSFNFSEAEQHLYNGLFSQRDGAQAQQDWAHAARLAPDNYLASLYLGGVDTDYESWLSHGAALEPRSCAVPYALGLRRLRDGRLEHAHAAFAETVLRAPDFAPARVNLGALCEQAGELAAASEHYSAALKANPDFATPALLLAAVQLREGQARAATRTLHRVAALCAHEAQYWLLLGKAQSLARDLSEAELSLARALQLDPTLTSARALHDRLVALLESRRRPDLKLGADRSV